MENLAKEIIKKLKERNETISFMESCTGGFLANTITNVEGASNVLKISLITYSNEYKIKFGVSKEIIEKYNVYSNNTSEEMAKSISEFAGSNWGIGITGQLGTTSNNLVYYTIYNKTTKQNYSDSIVAEGKVRENKKEFIAKEVLKKLLEQITIS